MIKLLAESIEMKKWSKIGILVVFVLLLSCSMVCAKTDPLQQFSQTAAKNEVGSRLINVDANGGHVTIVFDAYNSYKPSIIGTGSVYNCIRIFKQFKARNDYKDVTCIVTQSYAIGSTGIKYKGHNKVIFYFILTKDTIKNTDWSTVTAYKLKQIANKYYIVEKFNYEFLYP
jgi:hypothetical protein